MSRPTWGRMPVTAVDDDASGLQSSAQWTIRTLVGRASDEVSVLCHRDDAASKEPRPIQVRE